MPLDSPEEKSKLYISEGLVEEGTVCVLEVGGNIER